MLHVVNQLSYKIVVKKNCRLVSSDLLHMVAHMITTLILCSPSGSIRKRIINSSTKGETANMLYKIKREFTDNTKNKYSKFLRHIQKNFITVQEIILRWKKKQNVHKHKTMN